MARILVTGSSKGIGRATVVELARRGHEVVATARRPEALADLPAAQRVALDVADDASVRRAREEIGPVDGSLRFELGHFDVKVVLIEPGQIASGALDDPRRYFRADDPYLPLAGQRRSDPGRASPTEAVAKTVAEAVAAPERQFRWPVGADAEALLAARARLDDAGFDVALRSALGLKW